MAGIASYTLEILSRNEVEELERLERLAELLDSRFRVPGTDMRFGLDPLLGLVPVLGDAVAAIISIFIVLRLANLGVSRFTQARMLLNIVLDFGIGSVPVIGDILDVAYKVNIKNIALARRNLGVKRR
ncbi:MAG: DUF4112 domain-containing protein [Alphaproteobacteria bacterium]|nr:DUF4112 domain-containing protein [Alphaproteobacteria bacterium]